MNLAGKCLLEDGEVYKFTGRTTHGLFILPKLFVLTDKGTKVFDAEWPEWCPNSKIRAIYD